MEGKKQVGSSSSFTTELFGLKESSPSSGIFSSIFASSQNPKVVGRESLHSGIAGKNQNFVNETGNTKSGASDDALSKESESQRQQNSDTGSIYYEQRVQQPCHLSSSIYYGGQDIYSHPQGTESSTFKKDGGEDDSGSASRGNWWQGAVLSEPYAHQVLWERCSENNTERMLDDVTEFTFI
ncbi:hypothetical protein TIFTF001_016941 [Ficus carica]|uniref:Uncharacterized protein n=1 Tax=Ficus carica TaxID=3494 RepID=A0AA88ABA3_FICCA|nr:hypothetical protein TIFTF001_016941 [Ficus carica]